MNKTQKTVILSALQMKEASIKRAINTNKNPRFEAIYDLELSETRATYTWVEAQPLTDDAPAAQAATNADAPKK